MVLQERKAMGRAEQSREAAFLAGSDALHASSRNFHGAASLLHLFPDPRCLLRSLHLALLPTGVADSPTQKFPAQALLA